MLSTNLLRSREGKITLALLFASCLHVSTRICRICNVRARARSEIWLLRPFLNDFD